MNLIDSASLVNTLDNLNEKFFNEEAIPAEDGLAAARWITSRQGLKGSYRGMFAPTAADFERGIHVFTGENLLSASARHIMGQEASRAIWLLGSQDETIRASYHRATSWMRDHPEFIQHGTFCCGRCTIAYWRHVWVSDFERKSALLSKGLQSMRGMRSGDGKWHTIPFFYAIYTLIEMDLGPARDELSYARPVMERYLKRSHPGEYSERKKAILTKAMALVA